MRNTTILIHMMKKNELSKGVRSTACIWSRVWDRTVIVLGTCLFLIFYSRDTFDEPSEDVQPPLQQVSQ